MRTKVPVYNREINLDVLRNKYFVYFYEIEIIKL